MDKPNPWRKYETAAALSQEIENYFNGITYYEIVTDQNGNPIRNVNGEEIRQLKYAIPPSQQDLCSHLRISRVTWNKYKNAEWAQDICDFAELRIQAWRVGETSIRANTNGLQFLLANDSKMFDRRMELEFGDETRKELSMAEKRKVLEALRASYDAETGN